MKESSISVISQRIAMRSRELGITQSQIAQAINADQSQVSRVLSGKSKRASRVFNEVCNYVNRLSPAIDHGLVKQNDELLNAIASVWDGTDEHALAISNVIRSLGALSRTNRLEPGK